MLQRIQSYIEQFHMFADVDDIVAGVSGGADSMCLLRVLLHLQNRYGYRLSVVHIHHGIRGEEADRDASFVQEFCDAHGIGCEICKFDVPAYAKAQKMTEEEAGRKLRYDAFCEAAGRCEKSAIAVAHHMEDQAETLLYRLARGTGIKGLSGMAAVSRYREIPLLRPLLCLHREEILTLLAAWEQPYCVDATNESLCYARNRIRKEVLPSLCQINEEAVKHMVMVCEQAGEISEYLSSQAQKVCEQFLEHLQGDTGQGAAKRGAPPDDRANESRGCGWQGGTYSGGTKAAASGTGRRKVSFVWEGALWCAALRLVLCRKRAGTEAGRGCAGRDFHCCEKLG